jgi:hypothetical protein
VSNTVLIDTGPLYAIFDKRDRYHGSCLHTLKELGDAGIVTCWPVLTEVVHLLERANCTNAVNGLFNLFETPQWRVLELDDGAVPWLRSFMSRYGDRPADLADAALCYLAESRGITAVFTLDGDFSVYRIHDSTALDVIHGPEPD